MLADFFAGLFFAVDFLAVLFFAAVFLAAAFLAGAFFAAAFFVVAFLVAAFLAPVSCLAVAMFFLPVARAPRGPYAFLSASRLCAACWVPLARYAEVPRVAGLTVTLALAVAGTALVGLTRVEQHRLVNRTLGEIVPRIHALALELSAD